MEADELAAGEPEEAPEAGDADPAVAEPLRLEAREVRLAGRPGGGVVPGREEVVHGRQDPERVAADVVPLDDEVGRAVSLDDGEPHAVLPREVDRRQGGQRAPDRAGEPGHVRRVVVADPEGGRAPARDEARPQERVSPDDEPRCRFERLPLRRLREREPRKAAPRAGGAVQPVEDLLDDGQREIRRQRSGTLAYTPNVRATRLRAREGSCVPFTRARPSEKSVSSTSSVRKRRR